MILLVTFTAALTEPDAARLHGAYSLALDRYVPERAYVEDVAAQQVDVLRADFLVESAQALPAEMKLSPALDGTGDDSVFSATVFPGTDPEVVSQGVIDAGGRDARVLDDRAIGGDAHVQFALDDRARLSELAGLPGVVWIDVFGVPASKSSPDAGVIQSGSPAKQSVWDQGLHGENQIIHVLDEGPIDLKHCFFAGDTSTPGPNHRKVLVHRNLTKPDGTPVPTSDHANFVAGIAAGDERGNLGKHPDRGGAWAAKLVIGTWDGLLANGLLSELEKAANAGAVIHSNSWNESKSPRGEYTQWGQDVDTFTREHEDQVVLGCAGNSWDLAQLPQLVPDNLSPPGIAKNAICVSASKAAPDEMEMGDGIFGPTADMRRKPELVAVGCGTRSAQRSTTGASSCNTVPIPCGTSMATPNAAAAAALVRQYFTDGFYPTGSPKTGRKTIPSGALIKAVLLNSTVDMTKEPGNPNHFEGWGLIRLDRTLFFGGSPRSLVVWDVRHAVGLAKNETGSHSLKLAKRTEQLKITLVFADWPPSTSAFKTPVVNDLNLKVTAPDRKVYLGNDVTANGISKPGGTKPDAVNNVEMVIIDNPPLGTWRIDVSAAEVKTLERQGYAIVATGGGLSGLVKGKP